MLSRAFCLSLLLSAAACADEGYIEKIFRAGTGEVPKLGWFVPDKGFAAKEDAAGILIYAPLGLPVAGRKASALTAAGVKEIQRTYGEACEVQENTSLTVYAAGTGDEEGRALYTRKALPGEMHFGLLTMPLELAPVNKLLGWPERGTLRRDEAVGVRANSAFYSFHRIYNAKTGLLSQEAVVLHDKEGKILAHFVHRAVEGEVQCDDCGNANYLDPRSGIYIPLNMFELPGLPYPVVLLDTGTVTAAGLSMITFTPEGKLDQFHLEENVAGCK